MTPVTMITGPAVVLAASDIDTDQIIPARFLRKPRSAGYNNFLFHDCRTADPAFPLLSQGNPPILVAGANFGCGSSREGAVYALVDSGVRCVIAPGFGDIFAGNAGKNGLLAVALPPGDHAAVADAATASVALTVDLAEQQIRFGDRRVGFVMDRFLKRCLLEGLDDIRLTLDESARISAFEVADAKKRPWTTPN